VVELTGWEWILSHVHHEETDTECKHVNLGTLVLATTLNFGGHIDLCATSLREKHRLAFRVSHGCSERKICDLGLVSFEKDVVQFQVTMADAPLVKVGYGRQNLPSKEKPANVLVQAFKFGHQLEQIRFAVFKGDHMIFIIPRSSEEPLHRHDVGVVSTIEQTVDFILEPFLKVLSD